VAMPLKLILEINVRNTMHDPSPINFMIKQKKKWAWIFFNSKENEFE
jgi:hypothetical protein